MTVTLQPLLEVLGYHDAKEQRAFVKLLQASGAYGQLPQVGGVLNDLQADTLLHYVTYDSHEDAVQWLHSVTQEHMLRRPPGVERYQCDEPAAFRQNRPELLQAVHDVGVLSEITPEQRHYSHVLVLGAMEETVDQRLDTLAQLSRAGVSFDQIHLLGSERPLIAGHEPSAGKLSEFGVPIATEMDMLATRYQAKSEQWPAALQNSRVFAVNTHNKPDGSRANTKDTIESWLATHPSPGNVLVISNQPYVRYQDAAVKSVLPRSFQVETVGAGQDPNHLKISVAMDSMARQIDVGLSRLQERLKMRRPRLETPLRMFDPAEIKVNPAVYQFRSGGDSSGVTKKGRYVADRWDPILHGDPIMVHECYVRDSHGAIVKKENGQPKLEYFLADGHHRHHLAMELNEKGKGPGMLVAMVLSEKDGISAHDAKIIAAYKNIAHGRTDPVDTARVFKEAQWVNADLLPNLQMDKGNLRMSFSLSKLSDKALDKVAKGEISAEMAAKVAEKTNDPARQESIMGIITAKLKQPYTAPPTTQPVINVNIFTDPSFVKHLPGFVANLARERAKTPSMSLAG